MIRTFKTNKEMPQAFKKSIELRKTWENAICKKMDVATMKKHGIETITIVG